jgi:hypothetical protein
MLVRYHLSIEYLPRAMLLLSVAQVKGVTLEDGAFW